MLFNSYSFIFYFLIPVLFFLLLSHYFFSQDEPKAAQFKLGYLILVSIIFYAQWDPVHLLILLTSIAFNYLSAAFLCQQRRFRRVILLLIIISNLSLLAYYKYSYFFSLSDSTMILPLAISFFTFQQIAFAVDVYRGKVIVEGVAKYLFFVLFFPQLIAGPIVHYHTMMDQTARPQWVEFDAQAFKAGLVLFCIGLFKKVMIADSFAPLVSRSFDAVSPAMHSMDAWIGLFSFSFMIYFDFSGYADMAIGLALFFGIRLPMNFYSPYKATNLIDFWRRWHITLSNFLKDHIYIPLGGNRAGLLRQLSGLMVTMLIGGLWHGAGWHFIIWGGMHGLALALLHLKTIMFRSISIPAPIAIIITFLFVSLLWVLFRSENIDAAILYYEILLRFDSLQHFHWKPFDLGLLAFALFIIWSLPNSMQIIDLKKEDFGIKSSHAILAGVLLFLSLKKMAEIPAISFVYFNF